jgi:hypothetical protein
MSMRNNLHDSGVTLGRGERRQASRQTTCARGSTQTPTSARDLLYEVRVSEHPAHLRAQALK